VKFSRKRASLTVKLPIKSQREKQAKDSKPPISTGALEYSWRNELDLKNSLMYKVCVHC